MRWTTHFYLAKLGTYLYLACKILILWRKYDRNRNNCRLSILNGLKFDIMIDISSLAVISKLTLLIHTSISMK